MLKINIFSFCQIALFVFLILNIQACKKEDTTIPNDPKKPDEVIKPAVDPEIAKTVGFFLDNWLPKTYQIPTFNEEKIPNTGSVVVTVDAAAVLAKIPTSVFGHNANIWMTRMVDQSLFMKHISNLQPNVIRWPAGSGSDAYFWNAKTDQVPADVPKMLLDKDGILKNPGFSYGFTNDYWRGSLENYYSVLKSTNSKGVITVNYGYARYGTSKNPVATAAHLAAEWVRYDKGRTPYWEIGNENFGNWEWGYRIDKTKNQDGQPEYLTGQLYAQHFKVFADSMHKAAAEVGATIHIGAVLFDSPAASWETNTVKTWNSGLLTAINNRADYYIVHNYFTPYDQNSSAAVVMDAAQSVPAVMMTYIKSVISQAGAQLKPISMSEWNMWAKGSKQQVSNISGIFGVLVVAEAIKNNYGLAARWDLFNFWAEGDDHGLFSDGTEPGVAQWTPRPSYYYLYFFQKTMGDRLVDAKVDQETSGIKAYASTFSSGEAGVALLNTSAAPRAITVQLKNHKTGERFYWYKLEGGNDNGAFSRKVIINENEPNQVAGGPDNYNTLKAYTATTKNGIKVTVPAKGAVMLVVAGN